MDQRQLDRALAQGIAEPVPAISRNGYSLIHPFDLPFESSASEANPRTADLELVEADRVALAIQA